MGEWTSGKILQMKFGEFKVLRIENQEYEGMVIEIEKKGMKIRSRLAKQTPKKDGYFVAFWEKSNSHENQAFSYEEEIMLAIVVRDGEREGIFIFPKTVLMDKGIARSKEQKGKMAMRVYPEWCQNLNKTAQKTQKWQKNYFYRVARE
ncbi:MepB family protein [Listeria aquatica]|uniref:MepB family protein n=1 Tax=Listeria aquatica TaxID=1494960 RepID=A0A841ZKK8_9LIST|nr:MepB family protein [Listeria aquatica]MBC1520062.1 MepB family protein [Listeria aquatica]